MANNILPITDWAMSSSGLSTQNYRMNRKLVNNNNQTDKHLTAITYSLCYKPFLKQAK